MTTLRAFAQTFYCLLVLFACHGFAEPAQRPPGGGGREGRDPFFDALREVHHESPNKDLFDLLSHQSIRNEIKLSEANALAIRENIRGSLRHIFDIRDAHRGKPTSKEVLKEEIRKAVAPFDDKSYELLKQSPIDFKRLLGIYVQARNYRAALNEHVAKEIGLSDAQLAEFRAARSQKWRSIMEEIREDIQREIKNMGAGRGDPRKAFGKLFEKAEHKLDNHLADHLTVEQKTKLEELKGEAFDLPSPLFFLSPPGDSGRGPRRGDRRDGEHSPEHTRTKDSCESEAGDASQRPSA
jgi:hypothetical protein